MASNYGEMTVNSDLFDTAVVLDEDGKVRMAYQNGKPVAWKPHDYFAEGLKEMIERVRSMRPGIASQVTGFVKPATASRLRVSRWCGSNPGSCLRLDPSGDI